MPDPVLLETSILHVDSAKPGQALAEDLNRLRLAMEGDDDDDGDRAWAALSKYNVQTSVAAREEPRPDDLDSLHQLAKVDESPDKKYLSTMKDWANARAKGNLKKTGVVPEGEHAENASEEGKRNKYQKLYHDLEVEEENQG